MNRKNKLLLLGISWFIIVTILYTTGTLTTDLNKISHSIKGNPIVMQLIFVLLSTIRIVFFIPQTIFILIGSVIFGPYIGFFLSLLSLALSQSLVYFIGRYLNVQILGEDFIDNHSNTINIIKKYGYKILVLGIVCPIAPSDLITASAACIKLNYKKCISLIVMADAPMIFLYGFLGARIEGTYLFKILAVLAITFISYYSFVIWNKITKCA
ncbi:TVP38/TMEM64 family protein [Clostridium botulinum]|uniref:TVP38/TMEM64 family protein n=1 Tax=Clostridium botulinum TaxID=1491 RepID=UPI000774DD81|nr:VTT domain-containing protein [Clostridium botulinum]NFH80238.1 TVP38/TMEM64 family protein [Clostridium botulinum]NFH81869.1 TVP38/TMEM64 family protein [Clostridium botulinum]NFI09843.1 TVP38/TMEM64 family protein [Clostridium botulinum]NFI14902.1 TVP38/TMEM64 family protein [Clostridium botulinum]NFO84985.1 TVP38/TMEM64 family protein [Clostridium botulinum]